MFGRRRLWGPLGVCSSALLLVLACGESDKKTEDCATGAERCACYGNDTCDADLVCLSHLCVSETGGETGGAPSTGGRAGTGGARTGGTSTTGDAGVGGADAPPDGTAGTPAGGAPGVDPETGGTVATGGTSTTSGGTPSSGGTIGSGGQTGTGGIGAPEGGSPALPDDNYITNGDFSAGNTDWTLTQTGTGVSTFTNGHACVQGDPTVNFNLGWPMLATQAFVIEPGVPYTLSFRAMAGTPFVLVIKIGHATIPYTEVKLNNTTLTTSWASYSFPIVAASGDSGAGLVFQGLLTSSNSVCFDDVVLVKD